MATKTIRCTACSAEFSDEEIAGCSACPTCSNPGIPCAIDQDVTVNINWHELRILGMWASFWADTKAFDNERGQHSRRTLKAILARLQAQHPDKAALSLSGEVKQLANMTGGTVEIHADGKVETVKGEKPS